MGRKANVNKSEIIRLREEYGMSFAEIAKTLNCTDKYAWTVWVNSIRSESGRDKTVKGRTINTKSMRHPDIYKKQAERQQALFNRGIHDRIAFYQTEAAVAADNRDLKLWQQRKITFQHLCFKIAWNNYLETFFDYGSVPEEMMLNFLKSSGWRSTL